MKTMMILLSNAAEIALRTLGDEDRRQVHSWIDRLREWEKDTLVKSRAQKLELTQGENVYVLRTGTDLRIFFAPGKERIEVIDIARRESLDTVRRAS
jgi:mRNA-degrading endonuclease RelE of RelBE toxin-antitoxin system